MRASVLELDRLGDFEPFDKVVLVESLQYFTPDDLLPLLRGIGTVTTSRPVVYVSGVLDFDRRWNFYDTPQRRAEYEARIREGGDVMGNWWRRDELQRLAGELGWHTEFRAQDPTLNTAHYRFDAKLTHTS